MSNSNRIATAGMSALASTTQTISDVAALADDRALEIIFTPGANQKAVVPLITASVNPPLLVVGKDTDGTLANGVVRLRPAHFIAGVSGDQNTIGLAGKLDALLDSAAFGANSSGSTRTDLLYATLSYRPSVSQSVRMKPPESGAPLSVTMLIQQDIAITLGIVAGVAAGSPLASLPADSGSGKAAVYNFGLAAVSIANGFAGGAINQASITQLWTPAVMRGPALLISGKAALASLQVDPTPAINSNVNPGHVAFSGTAPTIAAQAIGAGAGCSATITGSDTRGIISLTTGTSPQPNATLALITFANPRTGFFGGPFTLLTPSAGATVSAASTQVSAGLNGSFPNIKVALQSGPTALAASTTYQWNYLILE